MDMQISGAGNTTYTDINTTNATITPDLVVGSLSGSGNISLSTGSLIIGTDNTNKSYSGVISSAVGVPAGVSKWGTGTQTLSGVNTFTGGTMINAGTLAVANDSALSTGTLTINDGGTLANNDTVAHTLGNAITLNGATNGETFTGTKDLTLTGQISSSRGRQGLQDRRLDSHD